MIPQSSTVLSGMSSLLVVLAMKDVKDIFLCNWHILWQNTLYLYMGKSKKVKDDYYKWLNWRHEDYSRKVQSVGLDTSSKEARSVEIY